MEQPGPLQLFYNVSAQSERSQGFSLLMLNQTMWENSQSGKAWDWNRDKDATGGTFSTVNITDQFFKYGFRDLNDPSVYSICLFTAGPRQMNVAFVIKVAPVAAPKNAAAGIGFMFLWLCAMLLF